MPTLKLNWSGSAGIFEKMRSRYDFSIELLKVLAGKLGYLLTLATSLGLWFGLYAVINVMIPDDRRNHVDASLVAEKIAVGELEVLLSDVDEASVVQLD